MRQRERRRLILSGAALAVLAMAGVVLYFFRDRAVLVIGWLLNILNFWGSASWGWWPA